MATDRAERLRVGLVAALLVVLGATPIAASAATAASASASVSASAFPAAEPPPAIFHGTLADPAEWTFYASITTPGQARAARRTITCGAVVVAPKIVLTASHCAARGASAIAVAAATGIDPHVGGAVLGVRRVALAPDADPETFSHDVAVLVLDRSVPASVRPVEVARPSDDATLLHAGARVQVAGVGITDNVDPTSLAAKELRAADMLVTPASTCKVEVENGSRVVMNDDEFCTNGEPGTDRHAESVGDPCYGDSGGPIVSRRGDGTPVLVGLVSTGSAACSAGADIQPRVSAFADLLAPYLPARVAPGAASESPSSITGTSLARPGSGFGSGTGSRLSKHYGSFQDVATWAIGALLVALGAAVLALARRRGRGRAARP